MRINRNISRLSHLFKAFKIQALFLLLCVSSFSAFADYSIGPDDVLRISVYGYDDLKIETRISNEGNITFPFIGEVSTKNQTPRQLEKTIASRLKSGGFIQDAQVNVSVLEHLSQQVSILGYVNKPGRYPLNTNLSIVDLIALAGGITDMGANKVVLTRDMDGTLEKQEFDLTSFLESSGKEPLLKLHQNDIIYVPKASLFYIYGEVQHPGSYRLEAELSVVKALSISGGLTQRGSEDRIVIKRKNDKGKLLELDASLTDALQKDDIVYVKERWF